MITRALCSSLAAALCLYSPLPVLAQNGTGPEVVHTGAGHWLRSHFQNPGSRGEVGQDSGRVVLCPAIGATTICWIP